jgi:competence protein ComEA
MALYTRRQLVLLLLLAAAAGAGLAVDHWRRAHPEPAARLERLDRGGPPEPSPPAPPPGPPRRARPTPSRLPLDVNHATEHELSGLPGVGPALASRIVAARPFVELDDLRRVRGMRRATFDRLRPLVTIGR